MIIGATHWLIAVGIAVSIHLAGMLWLSFPSPPDRQTVTERGSENIVVTLGRAARQAAASAAAVAPQDTVADVDASTAAGLEEPETAEDAASPDTVDAEPARAVTDLDTVDTAVPVAPDTGAASAPQLSSVAETTSPSPASTPENTSPEPESVPAQTVAAAEQAAARTPEVTAALEAARSDSTVSEAGEVDAAPDPGANVQSPEQSVAVDVPVAGETTAGDEAPARAPTEFADSAPVPEPSRTGVSVEQAPAAGSTSADPAGVQTASTRSVPDASAPVEEAPTVSADTPRPGTSAESVAVNSAAEPEVEVAAARQAEPGLEPASEPEVSEAARPETIDLQELQESGGGSGVAARYAGVLKGWLEKNMHYPRAARLAGQEGKVVVRFVIDRDGYVQSIELESESGFPLLDREAREMIERGDPFPGIPEDMPGRKLEVRVPVDFHVRDETQTKQIPPIYLE